MLIVDDRTETADILSQRLRRLGRDVRIANDKFAALAIAAEFRPAMALLDIGLPEFDGFCLATELRRLPGLHGIRLIAVTGYADQSHRKSAVESGFDDYILKPYAIHELNEAKDSSLERPASALV